MDDNSSGLSYSSSDSEGPSSPLAPSKTRNQLRIKKSYRSMAIAVALDWLEDNYHVIPGSCVARNTIYVQYKDYCSRHKINPQSAASFGKVVRLKFPNLTTRRLGTRGQSKYHYYGLGIKESSIHYERPNARKGITRFTNTNTPVTTIRQSVGEPIISTKGQNDSKAQVTSPLEFPCFKGIVAPNDTLTENNLETFTLMYRSHCQRVYDTVLSGHYQQVKEFLIYFWKGMPSHMLAIIDHQIILDIITVYDSILYKSLSNTLIPSSLTLSPGSCLETIIEFTKELVDWLVSLLAHLPECVGNVKIQVAEVFGKSLQQQVNLMQLTKRIRYSVLNVAGLTSTALNDLQKIDKFNICSQLKKVKLKNRKINSQEIIMDFLDNFKCLLKKVSGGTVQDYFYLIDDILYKHVLKVCNTGHKGFKIDTFYDFFLLWNCFVSYIEVEMIVMNAKSQETFKLLFLLLTEYILYIKDLLQSELIEKQYINSLTSKKIKQYLNEDSIQPHLPNDNNDNHTTDHHNERLPVETLHMEPVVPPLMKATDLDSNFIPLSPIESPSSIPPLIFVKPEPIDDSYTIPLTPDSDVKSPLLLPAHIQEADNPTISHLPNRMSLPFSNSTMIPFSPLSPPISIKMESLLSPNSNKSLSSPIEETSHYFYDYFTNMIDSTDIFDPTTSLHDDNNHSLIQEGPADYYKSIDISCFDEEFEEEFHPFSIKNVSVFVNY